MAGRGRGATLPAWMTTGGEVTNGGLGGHIPNNASNGSLGQFEDFNQAPRYPPAYGGAPPLAAQPQYAVGMPPAPQEMQPRIYADSGRTSDRAKRSLSRSK